MIELDDRDKTLLDRLQSGFPLIARPFAELGAQLGIDEDEILRRVRRLKDEGIIRQIGAIFDTRRLGYQSTLAAFSVREGRLEEVAAKISAHPGVSHNYARSHHYNLWFTLAVPPGDQVLDEVECLADEANVSDWLHLPALRVFKLRTHFALENEESEESGNSAGEPEPSMTPFDLGDIPFVRALQRDLPIVPRPFAGAARELGQSEEALLEKAQELNQSGVMRRFSAVLRHRRVGYRANGMACWVVPEARIDLVGQHMANLQQISHCYQRLAHPPRWPYSLFTMIHARTKDQVETAVAQLAQETGIEEYQVLYSTREFKKERVRYFEEKA